MVVFVLILISGTTLLIISSKKNNVSNISVVELKKTKYFNESTNVIANLILKKSASGLYLPGKQCTSKDKCSSDQIIYADGVPMAWALNRKYINTFNNVYLEEINKIIDVYANKKIVPIIGYGDYSPCRFTYEILKENNSLSNRSLELNEICKNGNRADRSLLDHDLSTSEFNILKKTIDNKIDLILGTSNITYVGEKYSDLLKEIAVEAYPYYGSDYYYLSLFDSKSYLERSYQIFDISLEAFANKKNITTQFSCRIGQLSADLYNVEKNEKYMDLAKSLIPSKNSTNFNIDCALLADKLINDFGLDYRYYLDNFSSHILSLSTDLKEENVFTIYKSVDKYDKTTRKNALVVGLMEKMYE